MAEEMTVPKPGDKLQIEHVEMILRAVGKRQENFPEDDPAVSFLLVMLNIGERYAPVQCVGGEWKGLKQDIPPGNGVPKCPNEHVLTQDKGLTLGWLRDR